MSPRKRELPPIRNWEFALIKAIHNYGGCLPQAYVDDFYLKHRDPSKGIPTPRYLQARKKYLRDNEIIRQALVRNDNHVVEIFYLGTNGARYLARREGKMLTGKDNFVYRKTAPRYLKHDWREAMTHMRVEQACKQTKKTKLLEWLHEFQIRRFPIKTNCYDHLRRESYTHEVIDDSFSRIQHKGTEYRFFWEIDRESRREPELTRKRLIPNIEMIRENGLEIFGGRPFRRVWICETEDRIQAIKGKIESYAKKLGHAQDASYFLFTTWDEFTVSNLLQRPIYQQGGAAQKTRLFSS